MSARVALIALCLLWSGCATVFRHDACDANGPRDPAAVVRLFRESSPAAFTVVSSVVFEYGGRQFPLMGFTEIDRRNGSYKAVGMNPLGVKLFELTGEGDRVSSGFVIDGLARYGDITGAVATDIRRIYFDLVPADSARAGTYGCSMRFRSGAGNGILELVFDIRNADLVEKNFYGDNGIEWRVSYQEYRDQQGKRTPQRIIFIQYDQGYRLVIREKELRGGQP